MDKKYLKKFARKKAHTVFLLIGYGHTRESVCAKFNLLMEEFCWMERKFTDFSRAVQVGEMKAYADDMEALKRFMAGRDVNPTIVKQYMDRKYGDINKPANNEQTSTKDIKLVVNTYQTTQKAKNAK